ncbi:MAG TPA: hypothetical protein VHJ76_02625 [Actinomycetota bacterium]|nr:hypothetical protein [Actinomycetota bacterium]
MLRRGARAATLTAILLAAAVVAPVPLASAASGSDRRPVPREAILIESAADFNPANGVRGGSGTRDDPYLISGWQVPSLVIRNTNAWVTIQDNVVTGQMVLDWIGSGVRVVRNEVGDLRVNQNVARTGPATDGYFGNNQFRVVGQLRHFDGIFEKNVVGTADLLAKRPSVKAVQFDGFNGARFRDNTIYGYVDVKLHGHHHGSRYGAHSHDHHATYDGNGVPAHGDGSAHVDHSRRYHEVFISGNEIHSDHDWALRYYDRAHTGDDRTAASETDKNLNCPHVHFTRVHLTGNKLVGAGIAVDVFNAFDDNHWTTERGKVDIRDNEIKIERASTELVRGAHGILVQEAVDVDVDIIGNYIVGPATAGEQDLLGLDKELHRGSGIRLDKLDQARVRIVNNMVLQRTYGVDASSFTHSVRWLVRGLKVAHVKEKVHYDQSVAREPD